MDKMDNQTIKQDKSELNAAWDTLIAELQSARHAIDDPALFPPEAVSYTHLTLPTILLV